MASDWLLWALGKSVRVSELLLPPLEDGGAPPSVEGLLGAEMRQYIAKDVKAEQRLSHETNTLTCAAFRPDAKALGHGRAAFPMQAVLLPDVLVLAQSLLVVSKESSFYCQVAKPLP